MAEPGVTFVATSSMVHDAIHPVQAEVNTWLAAQPHAVSNTLDTELVRQEHNAGELVVGLLERDPKRARIPVSVHGGRPQAAAAPGGVPAHRPARAHRTACAGGPAQSGAPHVGMLKPQVAIAFLPALCLGCILGSNERCGKTHS